MIPEAWIFGLIGGLIIGGAAAFFLLINGRIMGASGILGGLVDGTGRHNIGERLSFVAGVVLIPGVAALISGGSSTNISTNLPVIVIAGLLVGLGTRIANGCTSGHGVCGISRFSLRGISATLAYLLAGAVVMYLGRHVWGII